MIDLIIPTLSQGLLWSLLALGVYITFRVLDFADMTVEGSFPLGAAICVYFLIRDHHPLLALLAAGLLGGVAGIVTGRLHTKLGHGGHRDLDLLVLWYGNRSRHPGHGF